MAERDYFANIEPAPEQESDGQPDPDAQPEPDTEPAHDPGYDPDREEPPSNAPRRGPPQRHELPDENGPPVRKPLLPYTRPVVPLSRPTNKPPVSPFGNPQPIRKEPPLNNDGDDENPTAVPVDIQYNTPSGGNSMTHQYPHPWGSNQRGPDFSGARSATERRNANAARARHPVLPPAALLADPETIQPAAPMPLSQPDQGAQDFPKAA